MALQFFDGFDDYGTSNTTSFISIYGAETPLNEITAGAFGGFAAGCSSTLQWTRPLPAPVNAFVVGARYVCSNVGSPNYGTGLVFCDTSNNVICQVQLTLMSGPGGSSVSATRNGGSYPGGVIGGTSLGTVAPFTLNSGTWYEIEAYLVVGAGTTGSLEVKINGATVLNYTEINTQGTAGATIGFAGVWSSNYYNQYWDDLYGVDITGSVPANTFLSAVAGAMGPRVYTAPPTANDTVTWTPLSGANYSEVNDLTFSGDTYYNYTTTPGDIDLFDFAALTGNSSVLAVQTVFVARMDDAGPREVASVLNSGGTNYNGATRMMTANYLKFFDLYENDPNTGIAWAASKFTGTPSVYVGYDCIE